MSIPQIEQLVNKKEFVYFLGFLWADGYIAKNTNSIEINILESDFTVLSPTFSVVAEWNIFHKQRRRDGKLFGSPQIKAQRALPLLKTFLLEHGYNQKSGGSPFQILSTIPKSLHHYWWRGYFDGDGSLAISKNGCRNLAFWSVFNQDWNDLIKLMKTLGATYTIYFYDRKCGKSSALTSTRKESILKFGNYIYPNLEYDFGLRRKFDKFLLV